MQAMQYTFRLFGGRKGQTIVISGHKFVHGICREVVSPVQAAPLVRSLSFYAAYHVGSPEYDAALAAEEAAEAKVNGTSEVHKGSGDREPAEVSGDSGSAGAGPAEEPTDDGNGAVDASSEGAGPDANGDGHEHAGVVKFEESADIPEPAEPEAVGNEAVAAALMKLDPENDEHWVRTGAAAGKPKLAAVEEAFGRAGLTRQDLEAALPGWDRDKAIAAALAE